MPADTNRVGLAVLSGSQPASYADMDRVRGMIKRVLISAGLGKADSAAPFKDIIVPGATVLIKPNWVFHQSLIDGQQECLVTHPIFVGAVIDEVLLAKPKRLIVGDAPIQGAVFRDLIAPSWLNDIRSRAGGCDIEVTDFRVRTVRFKHGRTYIETGSRSLDEYIRFDLGRRSLLESISGPPGRFRVTKYPHRLLAYSHRSGTHNYLVCRELFDSDVIISLPKLKTHCKTGLTGALKNVVGVCGDKGCLPHHRAGGLGDGGDCYGKRSILKRAAEYCLDRANDIPGARSESLWNLGAQCLVGVNKLLFGDSQIEGSWSGNDTAWRMVLDLNRIIICGRSDGTLSELPIRTIYSLTDGIIAGQGDGPLRSTNLNLGVITFSSSSPLADLVHAELMRLDWRRLPLIANSFGSEYGGVPGIGPTEIIVNCEGQELSPRQAADRYGRDATLPKYWRGIRSG